MKIEAFQRCFKELCDSFDLDPEKKKSRQASYFNSKLGEMREDGLFGLVKQAKETLDVKPGFLPPIRKLIDLYYITAINYNKTRTLEKSENWEGAICPICDNIGFVSLERKDGERCGGFCCTCIIGQKKMNDTELGRSLGVYTKWLDKGYALAEMISKPELSAKVPF